MPAACKVSGAKKQRVVPKKHRVIPTVPRPHRQRKPSVKIREIYYMTETYIKYSNGFRRVSFVVVSQSLIKTANID
jgi:hypothetical protein